MEQYIGFMVSLADGRTVGVLTYGRIQSTVDLSEITELAESFAHGHFGDGVVTVRDDEALAQVTRGERFFESFDRLRELSSYDWDEDHMDQQQRQGNYFYLVGDI